MKRLIILLWACSVFAQSTPDAAQQFSFTSVKAGPSMSVFNGAPTGSANFRLTWLSTGFTGYTIALQGSQDGSTWANIDSSLIQQSTVNPTVWTSSTKTNTIVGVVYLPYVRVNVSSVTGTGTITSYLVGYKGFARTNSSGSSGSGLRLSGATEARRGRGRYLSPSRRSTARRGRAVIQRTSAK